MNAQSSSSVPVTDPESAYHALVAEGKMHLDPAQLDVLSHLQALHEQLRERKHHKPARFSLKRTAPSPVRSLYIWGSVGRGKSMLMDLFFNAAPVKKKKRIHFQSFMLHVHARLHELRRSGEVGKSGADPLMLLMRELANDIRLLCFDELQATDVADASLIFRLFEGLLEAGVVIVATSNHPPESLYTGGVQRERFDKLTALIAEKMGVVALTSPKDYRTLQAKSLHKVYFCPLGRDAELFVERTLQVLVPGITPEIRRFEVHGRELALCMYDTVARASFRELCETPLGAADYLAIAKAAETLILTGIPIMRPEKRNEARRFVHLIDALYEAKTRLICTAAVEPEALYPAGDGSFEFQRTVSRLKEMQSERYLA